MRTVLRLELLGWLLDVANKSWRKGLGHAAVRRWAPSLLSAVATLLTVSATALGQTPDDRGPIELGEITVEGVAETAFGPVNGYVAGRSATATKTDTPLIETPQSISVITRERLEAQNADSLQEALRYTPGMTGESFGFDTRADFLRIRGFDARTTGLYQDGLQLNSGVGFAAFRLEPYGAERIEVFRGPTSVLYGQANPGGLINFVSKRPTLESFHEAELEVGNDDRYEGKFDLSGPIWGSETVFSRLTGFAREADTQVDFVENDRVYFAPALTWTFSSNTNLTLLTSYQRDRTGTPAQFLPSSGTVLPNPNGQIPMHRFPGEPGFDKFDREQISAAYLFEHAASDTWTFRQNARYSHLDVEYDTLFGVGFDPTANDQRTLARLSLATRPVTDAFTIDNQAQARFTTGPFGHTLLFGIDCQRNRFDDRLGFGSASSIDVYDPDYGVAVDIPAFTVNTDTLQQQIGLYVQDQIKLYDQWVFLLGGRHDWADSEIEDRKANTTTELHDTEFTGRAGLVYLSGIGLAPYASYSESFLPIAPAFGQTFEPETGQQYEIGLKYEPPGANAFVTLAAFDLRRQNTLTGVATIPVQAGEIRTRGVELEGVASLDFGLDLIATYTYLDAEITESNDGDEGQRPLGVPEHAASLWAGYTIQSGALARLGFGGDVRYEGSSTGNNIPSVGNPIFEVSDYTLVDAVAHYDWKNLRIAVNAQNLFDKEYVAQCGGPTSCFYGAARQIVGSIRYRW